MNVSVFAGSADGTQKMQQDAVELGRMLAQNGHTILQGGSTAGLMGMALNEFQKYSDDVEIVIPRRYMTEFKGLKCKELHVTATLGERIETFMALSDFAVALPGGTGTLHEILSAAEMSGHEFNGRIAAINTQGYYEGLKTQIAAGQTLGLVRAEAPVMFVNTVKELESVLAKKSKDIDSKAQ